MSEHIVVTVANDVLTIRMARADKKNAITQAMYQAMNEALKRADQDPAVRVVVVTGSGDCFSAGNDLQEFLQVDDVRTSAAAAFLRTLAGVKKPVVAAVNGIAVGIGVTMLLHCDLVYAVPEATLQLPFINLALVPEGGSSLLLPRLVGLQRATELLMLGEAFSAATACQLGLVNAVVAAAELDGFVAARASVLAAKPAAALARTKALLRLADETVSSRLEVEFAAFGQALRSPELKEAVAAFMERRPPDFRKV